MTERAGSIHSREGYARLARELGGYTHPWQRDLRGPDPELTFDLTLSALLTPRTRVLEAGCGHGPDAARFGAQSASWTAYDFIPAFLDRARREVPHAHFHEWNGKGEIPAGLRGPYDLIVSRRGPTGVILRLPELAAPDARFLYVGPQRHVPQVPARLAQVGWTVLGEWQVSALAFAPTWEDWVIRCRFAEEEASRADWERRLTPYGRPYYEERHVVLAAPARVREP